MLNPSKGYPKIVEKFKYFICVSLAIILVGIVMFCVKGMNIGIDFTGGTKIEIELSSFASNDNAKSIIEDKVKSFLEENGCKTVGAMQTSPLNDGGMTYEFRLAYYLNGDIAPEDENDFLAFIQGDLDDDTNNGLCGELQTELETLFNENETLKGLSATLDENAVRAYTVGATSSSSLLRNTIIALLVAIVVMLVYIVIRFTFSSGLAAICALAHDVLIMVALTTVFQIPVNSTFIAAVITIVGYSINATIIIFDRIREELKIESNKIYSDTEIANKAIYKTFGRTILTTVTTLLMVVFLAILSVDAIKEFVLPIIFGLIAGTFSSVFLASSFWIIFRKLGRKIKENRESKGKTKTAKG